jgi:hypothetical protein
MSNFYCNFTLRGPSSDAIARVFAEHRRTGFASPTAHGRTVVYEQSSDGLDLADVDAVGALLSKELDCPALAAIDADDDELWLRLFAQGELRSEYSSRGGKLGALAICRAFGRPWLTPVMWLVLQWPWFVFECLRHMLVAKLIGIPAQWVVGGYRSIADGEPPLGLTSDDLRRIGS